MAALVLDSGAVLALAGARSRPTPARRVQAALELAHKRDVVVRIPTPVLAECYRSGDQDVAVDRVVKNAGEPVAPDVSSARVAGRVLARSRFDSAHAVDALVVASVVRLGGGVVATGDIDDITRLAAAHPNVRVWPI